MVQTLVTPVALTSEPGIFESLERENTCVVGAAYVLTGDSAVVIGAYSVSAAVRLCCTAFYHHMGSLS